MQDNRWQQRLDNYQKALAYLADEAEKYAETDLDVIKKGIIQSFEITHELAWKVMQDYLKYQGFTELTDPRTITRMAFKNGLIYEGESWIAMLSSRNLTVHTYDSVILTDIFQAIIHIYLPLFTQFEQRITALWKNLA